MRRFNVGDRVRYVGTGFTLLLGVVGVVAEVDEDDDEFPYYVEFKGTPFTYYGENELELVERAGDRS